MLAFLIQKLIIERGHFKKKQLVNEPQLLKFPI